MALDVDLSFVMVAFEADRNIGFGNRTLAELWPLDELNTAWTMVFTNANIVKLFRVAQSVTIKMMNAC